MTMENQYLEHVIVMLQQVETRANDSFAMLTEQQLNWKPNDESWSIAECLDHLIVTNEKYLQVFEAVKNGSNQKNFWMNLPFYSKICGNLILKSVDPDNLTKIRTFGVFMPRYSNYAKQIVCDFEDSQNKLIESIKELDKFNHDKVKIASPVNAKMVFTLKDACNIIWKHSVRHLNQAKRLETLEAFPQS